MVGVLDLVEDAVHGGRPAAAASAAAPVSGGDAAKFLLAYTVYLLLSGLINMEQGVFCPRLLCHPIP